MTMVGIYEINKKKERKKKRKKEIDKWIIRRRRKRLTCNRFNLTFGKV